MRDYGAALSISGSVKEEHTPYPRLQCIRTETTTEKSPFIGMLWCSGTLLLKHRCVGWWDIVVVYRIHRVRLVVCELIGHLSNHRIPLGCAECAIALPALGRKTPWISGSQLRSLQGTRLSPMGEDRRV